MKLYDTNVFPAFSTPIYVSNAVDFEEVIDFENIDQEEFFKEEFSPELGDIGTVLNSKNQNILLEERYSKIKEYCDAAVSQYAYDIIQIPKEIKLSLVCSWMIIGYPGAITSRHIHQNSIFSGVFYIKSPENAGNLLLSHPLSVPTCVSSTIRPLFKENNIFNSKIFAHKPNDCDIIIFPSHVEHEVTRNMSGELRCCIAFNYFVEGTISPANGERLSIRV